MTKHNINQGDGLLDKRQAAAKLRVSERALNYRMADGSLPYCKFGKSVRFLISDLEAFIQAHRIGS
jgi:predicted DNA-binding transcriptional regulator AlpA